MAFWVESYADYKCFEFLDFLEIRSNFHFDIDKKFKRTPKLR